MLTGTGTSTSLVWVDASVATPELMSVNLPLNEGQKASGLFIVQPKGKSPLAIVFGEFAADADKNDQAFVVQLDPNGDRNWQDAKYERAIEVGQSNVEGHGGHHDLATDADGMYAFITNPGDGAIAIYSLKDNSRLTILQPSASPSRVIAVGGRGPVKIASTPSGGTKAKTAQ